jgi:peroxiredoxin
MQKLKSPLSLWLLLGVMLIAVICIAIIDQVKHRVTQPAVATVTAATSADADKDVPVGWKVGERAREFVLTTTDNKEVKLSDYLGKNVILNFWATWCGPCRFEIPILKRLNDNLSKLGIVVLAISTQDTMDSTVAYAKYNDLNFTIPVDPRGTVAGYYNVHGIPTTYFIDAKGIITSVKIGPFISEDELTDRLASFK